ncbi:MAG: HU family DNA-binding protein [Paludibacteraceae bacterium]|nr:HU family DNA-binding protein [Paludibacteraceae bacterium]
MLTKDLINNIAEATSLTKRHVSDLLSVTNQVIIESLMSDKAVSLHGLGTLEVKQKNERVIVHPVTGARNTVPAKKQISFRPLATLKEEFKKQ